jgi:hypothetical protein
MNADALVQTPIGKSADLAYDAAAIRPLHKCHASDDAHNHPECRNCKTKLNTGFPVVMTERLCHSANRAVAAAEIALLSDGNHFIPFDTVVATMLQTGKDMPSLYRETSTGGLSLFAGVK